MARRHYRVFLYGKPISVGSIFQYNGETKKTAKREHQLMASPLVMMRAYPSVPVLMATPFSSLREAVGWYEAGTALFSPQAFHGVVKRLPNGRGWKVVRCNRNFAHERMLEKLKMHSVYGKMGIPKPAEWRDVMDYFAKRLHGMGLEELTHAFMEQERINPNEKNAFSCRAVGLVDNVPDQEFQNEWLHPDGFPKFATKEAEKLHIQNRDINSFYKDLITAPVIGIDPGSLNGDASMAARGFVTAKGIDFVSFDMVANPFLETVCKEKKPFPHTVDTERKSDYGIKVDFQSTLDRGLFPSKGVLDQWVALIKDGYKQKPKTVSDWIRDNENSDIKNFAVVKQQLLTMSNNKPDDYALKDIRLGQPVETADGVDVDVQFVIVPLKGQMIDIEIVNTRTGDDNPI